MLKKLLGLLLVAFLVTGTACEVSDDMMDDNNNTNTSNENSNTGNGGNTNDNSTGGDE